MPRKQAKQAGHKLQQRNLPREPVFAQRPAPDEPQVQNGKVARLNKVALFVRHDLEQVQLAEDVQALADERVRLALGRPWRHGRLEKARPGVELRQSVARAGDQPKDLRARVEKVEDLREEQ